MRQTILAAAAAFVIGGVATGAVLSQAQPAAAPADDGAAGQMGGQRNQWMPWRHHMHAGQALRTFALIYRQQDRQLAAAAVQKIAEAFLPGRSPMWRPPRMAQSASAWPRLRARSWRNSPWTHTRRASHGLAERDASHRPPLSFIIGLCVNGGRGNLGPPTRNADTPIAPRCHAGRLKVSSPCPRLRKGQAWHGDPRLVVLCRKSDPLTAVPAPVLPSGTMASVPGRVHLVDPTLLLRLEAASPACPAPACHRIFSAS